MSAIPFYNHTFFFFFFSFLLYIDVIRGKLFQNKRYLEVDYAQGRDIPPNHTANIVRTLESWVEACDTISNCINAQIQHANQEKLLHLENKKQLEQKVKRGGGGAGKKGQKKFISINSLFIFICVCVCVFVDRLLPWWRIWRPKEHRIYRTRMTTVKWTLKSRTSPVLMVGKYCFVHFGCTSISIRVRINMKLKFSSFIIHKFLLLS